ncbi:MAG TPA: amidohydrolase [Pseudomonadales bacterium]|nr:amidohydrolase [Pseudomonadales bacterium]
MQLYHAPFVLPMTDDNAVIEDGAVVVDGERLVAVGPRATLMADHPEAEVVALPDRLLMPGLVNSHMHSGLLRGTAEGLKLWDWLRLYIDPMHRVLQPHEAEAASWLCYAEALLSGTTTVVDMWRYLEGSARVAETLGNRAVLVPYVGEHPDYAYFDTLDDNERLIETWKGRANGRVMPWVGMEHMFYFTEPAYRRAVDMANRHEVGLHTHVGESRAEITEMEKRYGLRPVHAMERFGFLDIDTVLFAHCVWLDEAEIALMAEKGIGVAHNPTSNMKLVSGLAPISQMIAAGVHVGIGCDGEKENNNLDMFEEMKVASLLGKIREDDATAADAWQVLRMATIEGARALGLGAEIGSLEAGKKADFIAVRTDTPRMTPLMTGEWLNLHHNLVYAAQGPDVDLVVCDGRVVVEGGELRTAKLKDLIAQVHDAVPGLFRRRAAWLAEHDAGAVSPVPGD